MTPTTRTALCTLVTLAVAAPGVLAAPQTTSQAKCLRDMNKSGLKVADTLGKEMTGCLRDAGTIRLPPSQTADECFEADNRHRMERAKSKTFKTMERRCDEPHEIPDFGLTDAFTVNDAAAYSMLFLARDVYGLDIDGVLGSGSTRSCQVRVMSDLAKLVSRAWREFYTCKKLGLANGTIVDAGGIEACIGADPNGKVQARVDKLASTVASRCSGVDLNVAFDGVCGGEATFAGCVAGQALLRMCEAANAMDGVTKYCNSDDPTYEDVVSWVNDYDLTSVDETLQYFSPAYRSQFTLMHTTASNQGSSYESPRVLWFGATGSLVTTFNGDPTINPIHAHTYYDLEFMQFRPSTRSFEFRFISFPRPPEVGDHPASHFESINENGVKFSIPNPPACMGCHRGAADPAPNWEAYDFWPGAYGAVNDQFTTQEESDGWAALNATHQQHDRYQYLVFGLSKRNEKLTSRLGQLNLQRILRQIQTDPDTHFATKFAVLGLLRCANWLAYDPFPPGLDPDIEAALSASYGSFGERLFDLYSALGYSTSGWAMSFLLDDDLGTPTNFGEEFTYHMLPDLPPGYQSYFTVRPFLSYLPSARAAFILDGHVYPNTACEDLALASRVVLGSLP